MERRRVVNRVRSVLRVLVALLAFATPLSAWAGAWTQLPGAFYIKLSYAYANADEQIKCCVDERQPILDFTDRGDITEQTLSFYGEYGLPFEIPGGLTLIASADYKLLETDTERAIRRTNGFADIRLGLRWGLPIAAIQPVVLSLQLESKLPTGYTANLPDGEGIPYLGNGVVALTSSLLAGVSFWPVPVYLTGGFGFRWRGEAENDLGVIDYRNQLPWSFEAGVTIADRVLLQAIVDGIIPLGELDELEVAALTPPSTRSLRINAGAIVTVWRGLQVSVNYERMLTGVNILLDQKVLVGLAWAQ